MSTFPSGRHLGHYRSLVISLGFMDDDKEKKKFEAIQQDIMTIVIGIINYAIRFGYVGGESNPR